MQASKKKAHFGGTFRIDEVEMIKNHFALVGLASVGDDRIYENSSDSQTTVWSSR